MLSRRPEFRDNLAAIGHEEGFAGSDFTDELAESILEVAQTDGFHAANVASTSYIVNGRANPGAS